MATTVEPDYISTMVETIEGHLEGARAEVAKLQAAKAILTGDATEAPAEPAPKRGRPPGSKNKATNGRRRGRPPKAAAS